MSLTMASAVLALGLTAAEVQALEAAARPSPTLQRVLGEVSGIDTAGRRIDLKTDAGEPVSVVGDDKTSFLRAQPGARDLTGATPVTLAEIVVGDRVLARGVLAEDGKTLAARQVVVMSRADIAQKQAQERADWRQRGVSGVITAVEPAAREITVEVRSLAGSQTVVVATEDRKATFKRYATGSVRFSDAVASSFAELKVGDQIRVLGDRAPGGSKVLAEQVVSGSFQTVSGAVKAVEGREVTIVGNETGQPLRIAVGPDTVVRRLPPQMAARLAQRSRMGVGGRGPGGPGRGAGGGWPGRHPGGGRGGPPEAAGRGEGGPPRDIAAEPSAEGHDRGTPTLQDMLERLPPMPIEELNPGEQIAVASTKGDDPARVRAVVLLAGIEPLLEARPRGTARGGETLGLSPGALDLDIGIP